MSGTTSAPGADSPGASFTYFVLGAAPGRQPQDLLRDYLSMEWVHGTPTATVKAYDGQAITAADLSRYRVPEAPPVLTLQTPPASVPKDRLVLLRASAPQVLARAARLPLLPGETVVDGNLGVLSTSWRGLPAGSILFTRTSTHGTITFVLHGYRVDPLTGAIENVAAAAQNRASLQNQAAVSAAPLGISNTEASVIEAALTIAQFAGFALGPAGLLLAGGAAVLLQIFTKCMSSSPIDLSSIVSDAVRAVSVDLQIENADATIGVDYDWLHDHYKSSWADDAKVTDEDYQEFHTELQGKLDADTGIVQTVALLKEPDYQEKGFVLFLLGAGLVLLMNKIEVLMESRNQKVVDTYSFTALMTKLSEYITHGNQTLQKIDGEIAARLGQITEPQRASQTLLNPASGGVTVTNYWWWQDTGDGSSQHDYPDTQTGGCNSTTVDHQADAQADRDAHYAQVLAQLYNQYYAGDPDKAHTTVNKWQGMQTEFSQYAPKSNGGSSANLSISASASSSTSGVPPAYAVDGDPNTAWNSGGFPPAWIELDLKQTLTLSKVRLLVGQNPAGPTTHQLYFGTSPAPTALIATLSVFSNDMQWLEADIPDPQPSGRYLRVQTTTSPSWVAWREIVVVPQ